VNILNQENHAALSPHMATSIALDPFPTQGRHDHPGRVVNGVQVVTCPARTISSRLAAANLTAAGLDDYIVSNFDHNVELAVAKEIRRRWRSFAALARRIADTEFGDPKRDMHVPRRSYTARCQQWCEKRGGVFPILQPDRATAKTHALTTESGSDWWVGRLSLPALSGKRRLEL
jgi:hypothetical protein